MFSRTHLLPPGKFTMVFSLPPPPQLHSYVLLLALRLSQRNCSLSQAQASVEYVMEELGYEGDVEVLLSSLS